MATDTSPRAPLAERALAERVRAVPPSGIRRFFDIAATMDDVISLGVGEPDFDTPAGHRRGRRREPARGPDPLHQQLRDGRAAPGAVAATSMRATASRYDPATELLITVGASEAVDLALRATCDPGDEVILHEPSYVAYVPAIVFAGGVVRHVATRYEDDFALDPAAVEAAITPQTKALFLGYPCNPTGAVLPDEVQDALAEIAVRHDLLVYSDEIYDRLAYGTYRHRAMSALPGMRDRTILIGGFSKAYAMTGWRVGYVAGPAAILEGMVKVHQYAIMSAPTTAQDAALAAIVEGEPDVERMLAEYDRRRRLLVDGLNALGLETFEPRGAFYAFPRIGSTGLDDETFVERLLVEEHVAVVPGSAFGPSGAGHVRMCYATSYERLEEALGRIGRFVDRHGLNGRMTRRARRLARPSSGMKPSSGSRSTASCGRPRRCSAAARPTTTARRRTPTSARSASASRGAPDHQPAGRRARPGDGRRDRGDRADGDALGPQELLLPGPPEGLPDQPVRPAARLARPPDVRHGGGSVHRDDHARPPRGGHRQARPRDRRRRPEGRASSTSTGPARR